MRMDKEVKADWLEALRSGRYPQGRNLLRSEDGEFCCIGVLCEVLVERGLMDAPQLVRDGFSDRMVYSYKWHTSTLPGSIGRSIGLDRTHDLMEMNDGLGLPFDDIADYIEAEK